jgi:enamine deaminase RidA (YjgF/YER057c/UK114 family)
MTKVSFSNPKEVAVPTGYTHVVTVEDPKKIIYISGQVSRNPKGVTVGVGDLEAQTRQAFKNLLSVLRSQGASFRDVVKLNIYTTQPEKVGVVRKVREDFIDEDTPPASTFIGVTALADPAFLVEIEAVAAVK